MGKSKLTILIFVFLVNWASAQVNRYIVFLADKNGTPYSVNNPSEFLSGKAIERRTLQGIFISESDLPVNPSYVQQLKDAGASVFYTSKWMNAVLVSCDASLLPTLSSLGIVQSKHRIRCLNCLPRFAYHRQPAVTAARQSKGCDSTHMSIDPGTQHDVHFEVGIRLF